MDDPIPIALKRRAEGRHAFTVQAAARLVGLAGIGGKHRASGFDIHARVYSRPARRRQRFGLAAAWRTAKNR